MLTVALIAGWLILVAFHSSRLATRASSPRLRVCFTLTKSAGDSIGVSRGDRHDGPWS